MIRKWMTLLLSLLLVLSMPLSAMADTQHTFTVVPGELLASEQAIADLLNAVDLRIIEGDRSGALSVLIDDQELVTLGLTADTTGLYTSSAVFGSDVLYVTWEDGFAVLTDLMKASLQGQGITDPAALQTIESSLQEAKNAIVTAIGAGVTVAPQAPAVSTMEESMKMVEEMFPDDPQMVDYIEELYEGMTVEDGTFADEKRDTADQKYAMLMDEEDLVNICDTACMKNTIREALSADEPDASEAELAKATDEVIAEVKKMFKDSGFKMVMEIYTLDAGQTLVGIDMDMSMSIAEDDDEPAETMTMTADYNRLTDAEGVSYQADAAMDVDDEKLEAVFDLYRANSGKSEGMLGLLVDGEEFVVLYQADNTAADTRVRGASVFMRSGAATILEPAASARPLISFTVKTEPAPEEKLAALEKATPENSVNVLKLSDAEMEKLISTITTNGMQLVYTALGQLPTSVLNLLMSE